MTQFYMIRHAQSENNTLHLSLSLQYQQNYRHVRPIEARRRHQDAKLSDLGERQAAALSQYLPKLVKGKTVLVCSPMQRAIDTIVPSLPHLNDVDLWCHGKLYEVGGCYKLDRAYPGLTPIELRTYFSRLVRIPDRGWYSEHHAQETPMDLHDRVEQMYRWMQEMRDSEYETVIVVSHGAFMAQLISRILETELILIAHANTGMTQFLWDSQKGFLLQGVNDCRHIPHGLRSGDSLSDGWWPTHKKWDVYVARFASFPQNYPALYRETLQLREEFLLPKEGLTVSDYRESDARSVHFAAFLKSALLGFVQYDPISHRIRQMLVTPEARLQGIGKRLIQEVLKEYPKPKVHAWKASEPFYIRCGFVPKGEAYLSNGVWCQRMEYRAQTVEDS
ncbi:MAG: GNAT family N-acetyltransferase [Myxococcota bacterium]|nr:GNAT family N-acetyltransferase [Myxococcota bacterium]